MNSPTDDGRHEYASIGGAGRFGTSSGPAGWRARPYPGSKPRAILTLLGLHGGSVVSADTLVELLWGNNPPRTAAKALQTHISSLRRTLARGISHEDVDAEWWMIDVYTVEGDLINRCEIFDAADLDAALTRFDELDRPAPPQP